MRRERIAAETRLRRLLELVEEGLMSPRDAIFGEKLAEGRASIATIAETERSLRNQLGAGARIDDASVERFGATLRAEIMGESADLRRSYVRLLLIGNVSVNDNEIVIAGSTAVLEAAAAKGSMSAGPAVRSFDRKCCCLEDSNL